MANELATDITAALRPILGDMLSFVSVAHASRTIGKTADTIEDHDLRLMASTLTEQLQAYVGPDLASAAGQRVRELA